MTTQEAIEGEVTELEPEERGLVTVQPQGQGQHHVVTGMAVLAEMSDAEFQEAMTVIEAGQNRIREFQTRVMKAGEDYGTVKGIDRPFLHLPGAEKLCLLYGLAARQEADRLVGERVTYTAATGEVITTPEWKSAPLAYHVRTYIHVGSFDGPIVAMGYGEASSWEPKYRYINARPMCPNCGKEELIRRKSPPALEGKLNCPQFGGKAGCNAVFEPGDPRLPVVGKIDNPDPAGLAETLLQMAAKRSFVAATRRATGTSGLFTQDEDSPNVAAQVCDVPLEPPTETTPVVVTGVEVERGGRSVAPTKPQIDRLRAISKEKDLGPDKIAAVVKRVLDLDVELGDGDRRAQGLALGAFLTGGKVTSDQLGAVIQALETGEIQPTVEEAAPVPAMESAL